MIHLTSSRVLLAHSLLHTCAPCRCRLYAEHGLIIETSTYLEDIVMSDYFHIEDRCVVQPSGEGSIRIDVEIEVSCSYVGRRQRTRFSTVDGVSADM